MTERVLSINTGSSSLKAGLYSVDSAGPALLCSAQVERIGAEKGRSVVARVGHAPETQFASIPDHVSALNWLVAELDRRGLLAGLVAIGHRIVHGGAHYSTPQHASAALLADLPTLFEIDPEHLPQAVAAIDFFADRLPGLPQVVCFDTHFHEMMSMEAKRLPVPRWLADEGVRRYGFHGLSYESIMAQLHRIDPAAALGKIVIAHLGSGASMDGVRGGRSVDTTMGFTPSGGLMMGTRPGDLDPGFLLYLLQVRAMPAKEINRLLNRESGLLGVSETSQDVRDLLENEASDDRAREALTLFCHVAKKHLGGLVAVLGGIDSLVFTGGIGEHSASIRSRICDGLEFIGVSIDVERNLANATVISTTDSATTVRVMQSDESSIVARHTLHVIST